MKSTRLNCVGSVKKKVFSCKDCLQNEYFFCEENGNVAIVGRLFAKVSVCRTWQVGGQGMTRAVDRIFFTSSCNNKEKEVPFKITRKISRLFCLQPDFDGLRPTEMSVYGLGRERDGGRAGRPRLFARNTVRLNERLERFVVVDAGG